MRLRVQDRREEGDSDLRQAQLVMLKLLTILDKICKEENLSYWLDCGTLLGAVRHHGFIPWDDDLDIAMPRKDYVKFIEVSSYYLPNDVFIQTLRTDPEYPRGYAKLRDKYSTYLEIFENEEDNSYHKGIFIDIFPMDEINEKYKKLFFLTRLITNKSIYSNIPLLTRFFQKTVYYILRILIRKTGMNYIRRKIYLMCQNPKYQLDTLTYGLEVPIKHFFKKQYIFPLQSVEFEGNYFPCPNQTSYYLKVLYGNYLSLPPLDQRKPHSKKIDPFKPCDHPEILQW